MFSSYKMRVRPATPDSSSILRRALTTTNAWRTATKVVPRLREGFVGGTHGALIRQEAALDSRPVCILLSGTKVLCADEAKASRGKKARLVKRVRIVAPLDGWCSSRKLRFDSAPAVDDRTELLELLSAKETHHVDTIRTSSSSRASSSRTESSCSKSVDSSPRRASSADRSKTPRRKVIRPDWEGWPRPRLEVVHLDEDNFEATTRATAGDSGDWLVFFVASWCPYCARLPLQSLRDDLVHASIALATVDAVRSPNLALRFGIRALPTILLLHRSSVYEFDQVRSAQALVHFALGGFESKRAFAVPPPRTLGDYHPPPQLPHPKTTRDDGLLGTARAVSPTSTAAPYPSTLPWAKVQARVRGFLSRLASRGARAHQRLSQGVPPSS